MMADPGTEHPTHLERPPLLEEPRPRPKRNSTKKGRGYASVRISGWFAGTRKTYLETAARSVRGKGRVVLRCGGAYGHQAGGPQHQGTDGSESRCGRPYPKGMVTAVQAPTPEAPLCGLLPPHYCFSGRPGGSSSRGRRSSGSLSSGSGGRSGTAIVTAPR